MASLKSALNDARSKTVPLAALQPLLSHSKRFVIMLRYIAIALFTIVLFIGLSAAVLDAFYGRGEAFPDRTSAPVYPAEKLETVADLPFPPGNIAVSENDRIFFTFHPEARPDYNVAELINGQASPLQFSSDQPIQIQTVLSLRIDRQNRLWLLDFADHGSGTPQIIAIDLDSMKVVHHHIFNSDIAPLGSHLNDFQVDAAGKTIYIADASILGLDPALVIYDIENKTARRVLEGHESVEPDFYIPNVEGIKMLMFGVFAIRPGVDSIALDRNGEWLYFAPVTDEHMHRVRVTDLHNPDLDDDQLADRIEQFAEKTMSDGITTDLLGNIYISDLEHSAITMLDPKGKLSTLIKDPKLRWPDGFSFGPDGWLYVTASSLQHVIAKPNSYINQKGPYQIFRIKVDATAPAGH